MMDALRPVCARRLQFFSLFSTFYCAEANVKTKCIPLFFKSANLVKKIHSELRKINFVPTFLEHIMSNFYVRQFFREKFADDLRLLTFVLKIRFLQQCKK
jgi:hypothetical protein